jgi:WD40-like Beta Propeller Repeat
LTHGRRIKRFVALVGATLALAGCSSERMPAGEARPEALLAQLPTDCEGLGGAPARGHVSFVADGRLFSVSANGDRARCVAEGVESAAVTWGARGDRFLLGDADDAEVFLESSNQAITEPGRGAALQGLSRPEGTQVVFVTDDGNKLVKVPSEGGPPNDISFLARHDEAVYHPAGTHVAVVGEDPEGNYGIYLATNEGKNVRQLVAVTDAQEVYEPVFSHDGDTMFYVADHGGRWDLHSFSLSSTPNAATEGQLATVAGFRERIDRVAVSAFAEYRVAYRVGDCESGYRTFVHAGSRKYEAAPALTGAEPVGWLPNGDLIVGSSSDPCAPDPSFDLYRARRNAHDLIVSGVTRPAIRAALPPPPDPPGVAPEVIA